jgi:hypothetical protein
MERKAQADRNHSGLSLFATPAHGIIDQAQYSSLVATVIASAVIPTVIANAFYLPRHLLPSSNSEETDIKTSEHPGALVT